MEQWQEIDQFPNYQVSSLGCVRNIKYDRDMAQHINNTGTAYVRLVNDRGSSTRSISLLVARAFLPLGINEYFDTPINLNGDRSNNQIDNLLWRPRWFAVKYHKQFDEESFEYQVDVYIRETGESFRKLREPAVKYGLLEKQIFVGIHSGEPVWPLGYLFHT